MRWRQPAYRPLAETIVDSFRSPAEVSRASLDRFTPAQWQRTWFWLDASGLALYFLTYIENTDLVSAIDPATVTQLRYKRDRNRERSAGLFAEFLALNQAFEEAGIVFLNLKGFTLAPSSCPDPALRLQLDLDFLVRSRDILASQSVLERRGYILSAGTRCTLEFKAGHHAGTDLSNPYSATPYRSVELHLHLHGQEHSPAAADGLLNRRVQITCEGHRVPALSPADQLTSQALHILGHLRSANTRPAWLLEFANHVSCHLEESSFWQEVAWIACEKPLTPVAIGASALLARDLFGLTIPALIEPWILESVPAGVRIWLQQYGRPAVLADFPGTKLYLLLEAELKRAQVLHHDARSVSVIPSLRLPQLFRPDPEERAQDRLKRWQTNCRYILFRLRFHISEGLVYLLESRRWHRELSSIHSAPKLQRLTRRKQVHDNSQAVAPYSGETSSIRGE